jgi:hypothetical protein
MALPRQPVTSGSNIGERHLRYMRPVHNIAHKLRSELQHDIAAVDVSRLFLIHRAVFVQFFGEMWMVSA